MSYYSRLHFVINITSLLVNFFRPGSAGGLSLESAWQQISPCLQDSSHYSSRSQKYNSLDSLDSSTHFQFLQPLLRPFGDWSERTNYNWYYLDLHVPEFFQLSSKVQVFTYLFALFYFHFVNGKIHKTATSTRRQILSVSVPLCLSLSS